MQYSYFFSDDTGIRIDAPGNNTPSINNKGNRRGSLILEVAIIEANTTPSIDVRRSIIGGPQIARHGFQPKCQKPKGRESRNLCCHSLKCLKDNDRCFRTPDSEQKADCVTHQQKSRSEITCCYVKCLFTSFFLSAIS